MRKGLLLVAGFVSLWIFLLVPWHERGRDRSLEDPGTASDVRPGTRQESRLASRPVKVIQSGQAPPATFDDITRRAEASDPVAQRLLGERYLACMPFSLSPEIHKATLRELAELRGLPKSTALLATSGVERLCGDIDGGAPIPLVAGELWLEQAAKSGDLVARARLASLKPNATEPEEVNDLLVSAIDQSNPDALLAAAPLLGATSKDGIDPRFAAYVGNSNDEYAWAVAACRMGADCGPSSQIMTEVCVASLYCNYASYEQFVRAEVLPDGQLDRVDRILVLARGAPRPQGP